MDDAEQILRAALEEYGLGSLASRLYELYTRDLITLDMTDDQKLLALKDTPEYRERFKANELRKQRGLAEEPPSRIIALERQYQAIMNANGLPRGFYDSKDDYVNFIAGDVSPQELQNRIDEGFNAVSQANPETVRQMKELYGVDEGNLVAYFLDPVRTETVIRRQAQAAQRSAQARLQAGMQLSQQQAEQLVAEGVTQQEAQAGFGRISAERELYTPIAGEQGAISGQEQIGAMFGTDAAAAQRVATRRRRRRAEFEAGGGFATSQTGMSGLQTAGQ